MSHLRRRGAWGFFFALGALFACTEPSPYQTPTAPPPQESAAVLTMPPPEPSPVFEGSLEAGQTLSEVLSSHHLPEGTIQEITTALRAQLDLRRLRPGNEYRIELTDAGDFRRLTYRLSREHRYTVEAAEGGMKASREDVDIETRPYVVAGTIDTTLVDAVLAQGESIGFAMGLLDAFQWDINFYTDVQPGDKFQALVEKVYVDGHEDRIGQVLMAKYQGKTVGSKEAVLYKEDYFDARGRYLQKSFLSIPLNVLKITSRFGQRFHPILGRLRAHKGIDYGAARGTPVWSVADGRVMVAGNRGDGYGNQVMIEHTSGYVSRYAHLSRVSVARGQRIKQKMKVGDVGATGMATGPHLHFEILINGRQVNPARQKMLPTVVRSVKDLPAFLAERERIAALMEITSVASREPVAEPTSSVY